MDGADLGPSARASQRVLSEKQVADFIEVPLRTFAPIGTVTSRLSCRLSGRSWHHLLGLITKGGAGRGSFLSDLTGGEQASARAYSKLKLRLRRAHEVFGGFGAFTQHDLAAFGAGQQPEVGFHGHAFELFALKATVA